MTTVLVLGLIGIGAAVGLVLYVTSRIVAVAQPMVTRHFDLAERALRLQEQRAKNRTPPVVPPDLRRRIAAWGDESAQANEQKIILDLYEEFSEDPNPWDRVRAHLVQAPSDAVDTTLLM